MALEEQNMTTTTAIQDYVLAATRHAIFERPDENTVAATVPQFLGVVAYGDDIQECWNHLYEQLESWVRKSREREFELPIIDGIDPNAQPDWPLAGSQEGVLASPPNEIYANANEFLAALDERGKRSD
jgi:predicted RNase H-like HicB family nuclease